jgi:hypothetical protein
VNATFSPWLTKNAPIAAGLNETFGFFMPLLLRSDL